MTPDAVPNPTPTPDDARRAFSGFLRRLSPSTRTVCIHDSDADGVAAGVVWQRAMDRLGFSDLERVIPDRERNAWSPANRAKVEAARPEALFVLDLGSQPHAVLPGVPECFVDHHRPEGIPTGDTLISAYAWDPIPNTSLLIWELFQHMADVSDLDWIAAVGTLSDLGERAPFDLIPAAKKRYTAKYLKEATALVNAARRSSRYVPEVAARALLSHPDPRSLVLSDTPEVAALKGAREEVKAALEEAKKAAPVFSGNVALIRMSTPCQVHPLLAQIWRTRLPKYIVIAANEGYLLGRVNFSMRSGRGVNLLEFLRGIRLSEGEGHYGHGHDQASGGSLPPERWNELLRKLGFPEGVGVR